MQKAIWLATLLALSICAGQALASGGTERYVSLAVKAQLEGKHDQALDHYSRVLSDKSLVTHKRAALLADRGVVYSRLGKTKSALEDFNTAIKLYPEYPAVYNNRGSVLLALGYDREAIKDFNRAVLLAPGYSAAYLNRGAALMAIRRERAALTDYNRAVRLEPGNAAVLSARGAIHLKAKRLHFAMRDFSQAIATDSRFGEAYRGRATARMGLGDFSGAVEDLSRAIAYAPADHDLYHDRGMAYLFQDNAEAAARDFSKAIELREARPDSYEARGLAHALMEDYELAQADLSRALALNPRSAIAYANRAFAYRQSDQLALGKRDIATARRLNQALPNILWIAGEIEEADGDIAAAAKFYSDALVRDPHFVFAKEALERIKVDQSQIVQPVAVADSLGDWQVVREGGAIFASSGAIAGLKVPLETVGGVTPKLLDWSQREGAHKRYGVLRYAAGSLIDGKQELVRENVALIDIYAKRWLAVLPHREGARKAKWTWKEDRVEVVSTDGLRDVIDIVSKGSPAVAARRSRPRRRYATTSDGDPSWAPWAEKQRSTRRKKRRRRSKRKPKTLFEALFGN